MSSWGKDPFSADQKPKYLLDNEVTKYRREDAYASNQGWVMRAGSPATGNGNINAAPEILVAIGNLAGIVGNAAIGLEQYTDGFPGGFILNSTDGTANAGDDISLEMGSGLGTPTITDCRFIDSAYTNGGSKTMTVEVTWDEAITVAGNPQIVIANGNQSTDGDGAVTCVYTATGSSANRLRFTVGSLTFSTNDVYTLAGTDIVLNSGTLSDTEAGGTSVPASLALSALTNVTKTIT
tara:strand:+ start:75 stop:785 length:711 start_codon:yes stop_codon:yes gene_type:complete